MFEWIASFSALIFFFAFGFFAHWKSSQPWDDLKPRRIPWMPVMLACVFGVILALVHIANLSGMETGQGKGMFG